MSELTCFHCGEDVPDGVALTVEVFTKPRDMCCLGCEAVAKSIVDNGLSNYYKHRTEKGVQAETLVPEQLQEILAYDHSEIAQDFVYSTDKFSEVLLSVENVTCAACAWLIEGKLIKLNGIKKCNVNTTTSRIAITWDIDKLKLSDILLAIAQVGYKAYPFQPDKAEKQEVETAKAHLRKLIVAGLCTMQVMMFAIASYFDALGSLSHELNIYFRWISLIIVLPVVVYSALPFYKNSISAISAKRLNMDIPVTIAVILAYSASVYATLTSQGEVYFESVSMFVFFLLLGRFFEQRAKKKASQVSSNLLKLIPTTASLLDAQGNFSTIPAKTLNIGDQVLVKPGETIPGDGIIVQGQSHANEAVLTGEQVPVSKACGDTVFASTINVDSPITVKITTKQSDQLISQIIRLQEQASFDKPRLATIADSLSQYVVVGILALSSLTYITWYLLGNDHALWYAIAVLVATCPCALSLATPSAYTCARATMSSHGLLLRTGNALDTLTRVTHICFDKTGTLTTGQFTIAQVICDNHTQQQALTLAAALESHSSHPIARAFDQYLDTELIVKHASAVSGAGIEGTIDDIRYKLGNAAFVGLSEDKRIDDQRLVVYLTAQDGALVAAFCLTDELRGESQALIDYLSKRKIETTLLTGDGSKHANYVADSLGVSHLSKGQTPEQKLAYLNAIQHQPNQIVAMFGDGVNDAPVLSGAHISFAMGTGSDIAKSSADIILLHDDLAKVETVLTLSHDVKRIIKQNFAWALGYNLTAVPFAVFGYLPPYLAALGMSLSSLIVILNSLRLLKANK